MKPVCVRHRDGWCATYYKKVERAEGAFSVRTVCNHYVMLPWGVERRDPTCEECKKQLSDRNNDQGGKNGK